MNRKQNLLHIQQKENTPIPEFSKMKVTYVSLLCINEIISRPNFAMFLGEKLCLLLWMGFPFSLALN